MSFDPLAYFLAFLALLLAIRAFRHDHTTLLHILRITTVGRHGLFGAPLQPRSFSEFQLVVRNLGVSLHNVAAYLVFNEPAGYGRCSIPIPRYSAQTQAPAPVGGEFAHGMIGAFCWQSDRMHPGELSLLTKLTDPIAQHASIQIFSEGYLVTTFKVGVQMDNARRRWNDLARRLNPLFTTYVTPRGSKRRLLKLGALIPLVPCLWQELTLFEKCVRPASTAQPPLQTWPKAV